MAYIPFIYFTTWIFFHLRRSDMRFGAGTVALLWLDIGSLFEILLDVRNLYGGFGCNDYAITPIGTILYCVLWTIILYPLTKLDRKGIQLTVNKEQLFHYLCVFFIICGIFFIIVSGSYTKIIENLHGSRLDAYNKSNDNSAIYQGKHQFWLWIPSLVTNMWPLTLLCWFVSLNLCKQHAWIRFALLFLSAYTALMGFSGGGRAQILWWAITFLEYYFLFRPQLEPRQRKLICSIFGAFGGIGFLGFIAITASRFDSNVSGYAFDSFTAYAGQPLNNFCAVLPYIDFAHLFTDRLLPLTTFLQTHQPYDLHEYYDFLTMFYPVQTNVFFTCFGTMMIDAGWIGLLFLLFIYILVAHFVRPSNQIIDFSKLIILVYLFYFPIRGFFGWPFQGQINETLGIFMSIGLYIIFKYTFKFKK